MGLYLNSSRAYDLYRNVANSDYFVDKTNILGEIIPLMNTPTNCICITRPRRFGKTVMANMIAAFLGKGSDSRDVFDSLHISKSELYDENINKHNVIFIDFSEMDDECSSYSDYIASIKALLREDLHEAYPNINYRTNAPVSEDLKRIYEYTGEKFVFVLDEWDSIFYKDFVNENEKSKYLIFLKNLLKDKPYVEFAYMTGILPIAKYSSGSELNMFIEFTMAKSPAFCEYFGFTETEVDELHGRYLAKTKNPKVTREGLRYWYNGYLTALKERVYNPRSVVYALRFNSLESYWTSSGPYDEIFYYIKRNVADVRSDLALMIAGESVPAKIQEYAATSQNLSTKDEIFSAMVVYGFLSYENGRVFIPNKELMDKFADMIVKEKSLGYIYNLAKASDRMLAATCAGDTDTMAEILEYAHDTEVPLISYNSETELSAIVNLVYLSARDYYDIRREDKAGKGYVDFIFYPKTDKSADCIILELKINHTAAEAVQQIKDRNYALRFKGRLGEEPQYTGRILAVGIGYYKAEKKHECVVETIG